jgi:two-component system response regulator QseB
MAKILSVEDDPVLAEQVVSWLKHEKHTVDCVHDGDEAASRLKFYQYDLVILDLGLPKLGGIKVLKLYRQGGGTAPVLILTGKDAISEKEEGLDAGADDYLTKPFHLKELSARIRALLRRPAVMLANTLVIKHIELNTATHEVTISGALVELLPKEFALLEIFMRYPNVVFSPATLLEKAWSSESEATIDSVYTYIKTLRSKISPQDPTSFIRTIKGVGYKIES